MENGDRDVRCAGLETVQPHNNIVVLGTLCQNGAPAVVGVVFIAVDGSSQFASAVDHATCTFCKRFYESNRSEALTACW